MIRPATDPPPRRWPRWHPHAWPLRVKVVGLLVIALAVWGWVDVRVRGTVDPLHRGVHKTDFTVYTEAGAAFFDGREPYEVTNPRGWGYLYPPPFAMLVAPLSGLPPQAQVLVWFSLSVLLVWGCYRECVRIARAVMPLEPDRGPFGPIPNWLGSTAVAAALIPALNCLQRGQVGVAKLYLLLVGFRLCIEARSAARSFLAGCVLALPIVLKVTPLVPVGLLVFEQLVAGWFATARRRALPRATALGGGVVCGLLFSLLLLPASLVGWRANLDHLDTWWHRVAARPADSAADAFAGDSASPRNQSLTNAVYRFGNWTSYYFAGGPPDADPTAQRRQGKRFAMDAPIVARLLLAARVAAGCLLLAVGYRTARAHDRLQLAAAFGLACVASLILSPIARGHYYVLLLPATLFVSAWLARERRPGWAVCSAAVPAALVLAHYALLGVAGRIGLLGIGTTLWYTVACLAIVRLTRYAPADTGLPISVRWDPSSTWPAWPPEPAQPGRRDAQAPTIS